MQAHARARAHTHTHAHPLKRTHAHKSTGTCAATHSHNSGREAKALLFRSTHRPTRGLDCEPEHNEKCNEGCTHITFEVCRTRVYSIHGGSSRVTIMGEGVPSSQSRGTREILPACGLAAYMLCPHFERSRSYIEHVFPSWPAPGTRTVREFGLISSLAKSLRKAKEKPGLDRSPVAPIGGVCRMCSSDSAVCTAAIDHHHIKIYTLPAEGRAADDFRFRGPGKSS